MLQEQHSESCDFEELTCPYQECGVKYLRREKKRHEEKTCKHRMVTCRRCKRQVAAVLMKVSHYDVIVTKALSGLLLKVGRTLLLSFSIAVVL